MVIFLCRTLIDVSSALLLADITIPLFLLVPVILQVSPASSEPVGVGIVVVEQTVDMEVEISSVAKNEELTQADQQTTIDTD